MSTEVETSLDFSKRAERADVLWRRRDQRFLQPSHEAMAWQATSLGMTILAARRYNFQTVFPPTIVRTARPFNFQPLNGELREAD
jgi:hypothetical protein